MCDRHGFIWVDGMAAIRIPFYERCPVKATFDLAGSLPQIQRGFSHKAEKVGAMPAFSTMKRWAVGVGVTG